MADCLHAEGAWGDCKGNVSPVQNPTTGRVFMMCDAHAERYYQELDRIQADYPEINQPCPDCGAWECQC